MDKRKREQSTDKGSKFAKSKPPRKFEGDAHSGPEKRKRDYSNDKPSKFPKMKPRKFEGEVQSAKQIWEQTRAAKPKEAKVLVGKLYNSIKGKIADVAFKHDTSRIVQTVLKVGNAELRTAVFEELKGHVGELCKHRYSTFLVNKLLKYCDKTQRSQIIQKFIGRVPKMLRNVDSAAVIEYAFTQEGIASAVQKHQLLVECYGSQFLLLQNAELNTLGKVVAAFPDKRASIMNTVYEFVQAQINKQLLKNAIVQRVIVDFFEVADIKTKMDVADLLKEECIHILHTVDGHKIAMWVLMYLTPKGRKHFIKSMKKFVTRVCIDEYGSRVMIKLFRVVDDTGLINKVLLTTVVGDLEAQVPEKDPAAHLFLVDKFASRVLVSLLQPALSKFLSPAITNIIEGITISETGDYPCIPKKDTDLRFKQLLDAIAPKLVEAVAAHADELMRSDYGKDLLFETLDRAPGSKAKLLANIAKCASAENSILTHASGHRLLRRCIALKPAAGDESDPVLAELVLQELKSNVSLSEWALHPQGGWVVLSLLEHEATKADTTRLLKSSAKAIAVAENPACIAITANLQGKSTKKPEETSKPAAVATEASSKKAAAVPKEKMPAEAKPAEKPALKETRSSKKATKK